MTLKTVKNPCNPMLPGPAAGGRPPERYLLRCSLYRHLWCGVPATNSVDQRCDLAACKVKVIFDELVETPLKSVSSKIT